MKSFPEKETNFLLSGPAGDLELLAVPADPTSKTTAIICHPHPLFSGTMNNKVVTTLNKVFVDLNLSTVRFNFRGVGKSTGEYGDAIGELADLMAVIQWVKRVRPEDSLWLAGFSFGSYIAACAAAQINVEKLICVAPPVENFDFSALHISCDWTIVQGDQDEVVDAKKVYALVESLNPQPKLIRFADTGHFFHGKLIALHSALKDNL